MYEDILAGQPRCTRRLRSGPVGPHIDRYLEWLATRRYRPSTVSRHLYALARYGDWLEAQQRSVGQDALDALVTYQSHLDERILLGSNGPRPRRRRGDLSAIRRFTGFLVDVGIAAPAPHKPTIEERHPMLGEFAEWMRRHRGLRSSSVRVYLTVLARLVHAVGEDPSTYTAARLRSFVLTESGKFGVERAGTITIATRGLVRFLVAKGRLTEGMEGAIPYPAKWGLASLPRFIEADEVEKAVAACDPSTPAGQRDRAIVLLFARLGLRAGEVAALCFDDIDWSGGVLGVSGKGRRHCLMPLPQDVGDATLAYIRDTRPRVANTHLFLGHSAPHRELSVEGVAKVGARALRRAGVQSPSYGSHVFRHSVATTMLRGGASLAAVGAVLRHSRPETTAHYAKVDLGMLSEIAQPWPEVSPC